MQFYYLYAPAASLPTSLYPTMFYEGDLQSGISLAIQESKLVACFVRGEDISPWKRTRRDNLLTVMAGTR